MSGREEEGPPHDLLRQALDRRKARAERLRRQEEEELYGGVAAREQAERDRHNASATLSDLGVEGEAPDPVFALCCVARCWHLQAGKAAARPLEDWHEDDGFALWWSFPVEEPPYVGSPLCGDWPGRHTHWTPIPIPQEPRP